MKLVSRTLSILGLLIYLLKSAVQRMYYSSGCSHGNRHSHRTLFHNAADSLPIPPLLGRPSPPAPSAY